MAGRRRMIAVYWVLQAAAMLALFPVLVSENPLHGIDDVPAVLMDPDYLMWAGPVVLGVTCMQAAFLRPVMAPRAVTGGHCGGWLCALAGHAASAAALSFGAALLLFALLATAEFNLLARLGISFGGSDLLVVTVGILAGGTLLLTPVLAWRYRAGSPVWLSLTVAGLAVAGLASALAYALLALFRLTMGGDAEGWGVVLIAVAPAAITWPVATPLLLAFVRRGDRESRMARVASVLFLGTAVETAAVLPLDVVVRRRSTCYCGESTFWSLVILGAVGFFALGPVLYLMPFQKRRRRWLGGRCEVCGYDMRSTPRAERCPECGSGWRAGPGGEGSISGGPGEPGPASTPRTG